MKVVCCVVFCLVFVVSSLAQERYIQVTTGGGVVGTATRYKISRDGRVLKGRGLGEINYTEESKLKKRSAKKFFNKSKALLTSNSDFNHPGNIYFSILVYNQGKESQMTWGDASHPVPGEAEKLYQEINTVLNRLTFVPELRK